MGFFSSLFGGGATAEEEDDWTVDHDHGEDVAEGVSVTSDGRYVIGCDDLNVGSSCGNTGKVDCTLCENNDPSRFYGGEPGYRYDRCIDCGEPEGVIGEVDCELCHGQGYIPCDADGNTG